MTQNVDDEDQQTREHPDHVIISIHDELNVIHLPDANVEATDTDNLERTTETPINSFTLDEQPSTSRQNGEEARALVHDLLETLIPQSGLAEVKSNPIIEETTSCLPEERLHHILELLHQFSCNLETIAQQRKRKQDETPSHYPLLDNLSTEVAQRCDLGTQTTNTGQSLRLNVSTVQSTHKTHSLRSAGQQQQQSSENRPPCERTHHTITITTNSATTTTTPRARNNRQRSLAARLGQSLGDFAAAVCLCMHINKDCVFCLGFFLAFVVSASFLTAFFYRTLTMNVTAVRIPVDSLTSVSPNVVTIRINGGYYYLYNGQKSQFA